MRINDYIKYEKLCDIPVSLLQEMGVKCALIDMDSTLLVWRGEKIAEPELNWCKEVLAQEIKIIIVSNAVHERAGKIAKQLNLDFVSPAMKPFPFGLIKAKRMAGAKRRECVMIGDQLLTDRVSSWLAGMRFMLVEPLSDVEFKGTKINRKIENFLFKRKSG